MPQALEMPALGEGTDCEWNLRHDLKGGYSLAMLDRSSRVVLWHHTFPTMAKALAFASKLAPDRGENGR